MTQQSKKVMVCTGSGRPKGLGEAILQRFAQDGYQVVVSDIEGSSDAHSAHLSAASDRSTVASTLAAITGDDVPIITCDVRDPASVKSLFAQVIERYGRLDVLVNNAGIGFVMKHTREVSAEEWQLVLDVTLSGVFHCTQAAAAIMEQQGWGGRIINIASQAAKSGFPHMAPYCAAKHGVIGLTRTAAVDYGAAQITVNAVCPNHVTTGLGSAQNAYFSKFFGQTETEYLQGMRDRIPLKRIGLGSDTASLCAFLASEEASFITGEAINVSGGEEMH